MLFCTSITKRTKMEGYNFKCSGRVDSAEIMSLGKRIEGNEANQVDN